VVPKKAKLPPGQDPRTKKKKPKTPKPEQEHFEPRRKQSFFKRVFGRKSGI
jgi:hypothetical protein